MLGKHKDAPGGFIHMPYLYTVSKGCVVVFTFLENHIYWLMLDFGGLITSLCCQCSVSKGCVISPCRIYVRRGSVLKINTHMKKIRNNRKTPIPEQENTRNKEEFLQNVENERKDKTTA